MADPDNLTLANATVQVTGGTFAGDGDVLAANVAGTCITASYNAATETLTLSGSDTLAHYQQVLDSVTFSSTSPNPTNSGARRASRTVSWAVRIDGGAASSAAQTATVSITAVERRADAAPAPRRRLAPITALGPATTLSSVPPRSADAG